MNWLAVLIICLERGIGADPTTDTSVTKVSPWAVLEWGGKGAPSLRNAGPEELAICPTAVAAGSDALWVADPADSEVLRINLNKRVDSLAAPLCAVDIAVDQFGRIGLLGQEMNRVGWRDRCGVWKVLNVEEQHGPLRALGWDGAGGLWGQRPDGTALLLDRAADHCPGAPARTRESSRSPDPSIRLGSSRQERAGSAAAVNSTTPNCSNVKVEVSGQRALPLPGGPAHALAKVGEGGKGVVWVWPWDAEAKFQAVSVRRVAVESKEQLGSLRPLAHDPSGRLDVLLETLSGGTPGVPLSVTLEIVRFDRENRKIASFRLPSADVCPVYRAASVGGDGTLWVINPTRAGLEVYRLDPNRWRGRMEVQR